MSAAVYTGGPGFDLRAERERLRDMPDVGRVRTRTRDTKQGTKTYYRIDFSPALRGAERFLYGIMGGTFESEAEAERIRQRICELANRLPIADAVASFRQPQSRPNLVRTQADKWLEHMKPELAPYTVEGYEAVLKNHFDFWDGKSIHEVTTANIRDWIVALREKGLGAKTIKNAIVPLHSLFTYYREAHPGMPEPVWPRLKVPRNPQKRMPLEDILSALGAIPDDHLGLFLCSFYTLCRPGESRALSLGSYDFATGALTIQAALKTKSGVNPKLGETKTAETGEYPLPSDLRAWISRYRGDARLDRAAPLFPNMRTGKFYRMGKVQDVWRAACKSADVAYVSVYPALKHSPGTALLEAGLSRDDIQAAFRHKSGRTTMIYDLDQSQRRARATERLGEMTKGRFGQEPEPKVASEAPKEDG